MIKDLLGEKDLLVLEKSEFPIFKLDVLDYKGLWTNFKLKSSAASKETNAYELVDYLRDNPFIYFEILMYEDEMKRICFFKKGHKSYLYTLGKIEPDTTQISQCRFYFNIEKFMD